ncbi:MAG: GntR family transcriptional regulator [Oscillospiraceae bacterium]|nr:GntR family transcriptional regulator [Oscillospiraceae bacterium]
MREHKNISIADQIFEQLEKDILSGRYARGEVISELSLSKTLGVSRTPVREAIRRLEQEDFLEETGKGMVVVGISREDMLDMYQIRLSTEGEAARRAAANIDDGMLNEMRDIIDLQRFYSEKSSENREAISDQIKNLDSRFHELLYRASGSKIYYTTLYGIHKRMTKFRKASVSKQSRALQSVAEHDAIYDALLIHDADAVEETVLTHVRNARGRMLGLEES